MERLALIIGLILLSAAILIRSLAGLLTRRKPRMQPPVPPPLPAQRHATGTTGMGRHTEGLSHVPPLPTSGMTGDSHRGAVRRENSLPPQTGGASRSASIYCYPKCPYHRIKNEPGQPQVIIQEGKDRYYCCRGHYFTGKEQ